MAPADGSSNAGSALDPRAQVRAIATALLPQVGPLADDLVGRILHDEPDYLARRLVAADDLRRSCCDNLERIVQALGDQVPEGVDPYDAPAATGRRRAAQGMPLEAVLHSYRLGGRVIWEGIVALGASDPADPANLGLLRVASLVWEEIDRFSTALAHSYREEESRLRTQHRHQQQLDVSVLLAGDADDAERARLAARLGLPDGEDLVVLAVLLDDPGQPLFAVADELARAGVHAVWAVAAGVELGVVRLAGRDRTGLLDRLAAGARQRVGCSPVVRSLGTVAAAARLAELAARTLPPGPRVGVIEQRLPEALVLAAPDLAALLLQQTVDRVLAAGADGPVLVETVAALLEEAGSYSRAAGRLYCHRNTVIHRAGRVADLCPHDPAEPAGALVWALALRAHEQRRDAAGVASGPGPMAER